MIRAAIIIALLAVIWVREYQHQMTREQAILQSECPDYEGRKLQRHVVNPSEGTLTCTYMDVSIKQVK